jgi:flavin-dependent dehydrogenase
MNAVDVAVVGGGPAGLSAALALAQKNLSVRLFERGEWPLDRACGEGILPQGLAALRSLGVSVTGMPIRGIEYHDRDAGMARGNFAGAEAMGVRRTVLSKALLEACRDHVDLRSGCAVNGIERGHDGWLLDSESGPTKARFLVAADGPRSALRRRFDLDARAPINLKRLGWRQHLRVAPKNDHVEVHWGDGCEAYLTPVAPDELGLAFLWRDGLEVPQGADRLGEWLRRFDGLSERFAGAEACSVGRGIGPMAVAAQKATFYRGCFVGDALAFFDGITGEGLSAAFEQAHLLARLLPDALDQAEHPKLEAALLGALKAKRRLAKQVLILHQHPRVRRRVISLFRAQPRLFDWALKRGLT